MNRRSFLKWLGCLPFAGLLAGVKLPEPAAPVKVGETYVSFPRPVKGIYWSKQRYDFDTSTLYFWDGQKWCNLPGRCGVYGNQTL